VDRLLINRRYRVERLLGEGSMARVFLGHDQVLDRDIVIKLLRPGIASNHGTRSRFDRAVQAAARLSHPHIVDVYDVGDHDDMPFIIMEYVQGETLKQIIDQEAPFAPDDVAALVEQVAVALDHAHDRGIIHRDIKPQNILVAPNGIAKLVDFGIAGGLADPLTTTVHVLGTTQYAAPEAVSGGHFTPASDVYSLGIVAYEMLTGQLPFHTKDAPAAAFERTHAAPIAPSRITSDVPPQCDVAILQALAEHPSRRQRSAGQFAANLTNWRSSETQNFIIPSQPQRASVDSTRELPLPPQSNHEVPTSPEAYSPSPLGQSGLQRWRGAFAWLGTLGVATTLIIALAFLNPGRDLASTIEGLSWNPFREADPTPLATDPSDETSQAPTDGAQQGIPDVRGLSVEAARAVLAEQGLELREDPPVFSRGVSTGEIAEQDPPPGSARGFGEIVFIKTSRGSAETELSQLALEGQSVESALAHLNELGLRVQQEERGSRTVPPGTVIEVAAPSSGAVDDTVTLIVSMGDKVQVPRETFGSSVESATSSLRATGFNVAEPIGVDRTTIERQISLDQLDIGPGDVVGVQNAEGNASFGAWLQRGATVTLVFYDPALD
jgi:serine/threonine-protein kinase